MLARASHLGVDSQTTNPDGLRHRFFGGGDAMFGSFQVDVL